MITRRAALGAALSAPFVSRAAAQGGPSRAETLLLVQEYGPNSLDMQGIGSAQPVNGVAHQLLRPADPVQAGAAARRGRRELQHDRPRAGTRRELAGSVRRHERHVPSCARRRFHRGRPVTARDVKWSLDRAVSIGGFATTQMAAG